MWRHRIYVALNLENVCKRCRTNSLRDLFVRTGCFFLQMSQNTNNCSMTTCPCFFMEMIRLEKLKKMTNLAVIRGHNVIVRLVTFTVFELAKFFLSVEFRLDVLYARLNLYGKITSFDAFSNCYLLLNKVIIVWNWYLKWLL